MSETATKSRRWRDSKLVAFVAGAVVGVPTSVAVVGLATMVVGVFDPELSITLYWELVYSQVQLVFVGAAVGGAAAILIPRRARHVAIGACLGMLLALILNAPLIVYGLWPTRSQRLISLSTTSLSVACLALGVTLSAWWARRHE